MELNTSTNEFLASANKEAVEQLKHWLRQQLQEKSVPRLADVWQYAQNNVRPKLTKKQVSTLLRLHKDYLQVMHQQRAVSRSRKYRPIITNALGYMHGDIGFFSVNDRYPTPPTFRAGYLVLVDILSRRVYLEVLKKRRNADAVIKALEKILDRVKDYPIKGISFDLEPSIISKKVQSFLAKNHIKFTPFKFSNTKAKFAENAINRVRKRIEVLEKHALEKTPKEKQTWWKLLRDVEKMLNNKPIMIENALLPFTPAGINPSNVENFIASVQLRSPAQYFGQFNIDPRLVQFKFKIGDYVKAKTIVTSASVLGDKRSTHQLTKETFIIVHIKPYYTKNQTLGIAYLCKDIEADSANIYEFNEEDLAIVEPQWS